MPTLIGSNTGISGLTGSLTTTTAVAAGDTIWAILLINATSPTFGSISDPNGAYTVDSNNLAVTNVIITRMIVPAGGLASGSTISFSLSAGSGVSSWIFKAFKETGAWIPDGSVPSWNAVTSDNKTPVSATASASDFCVAVAAMFGTGSLTATSSSYPLLDSTANSPRAMAIATLENVAIGGTTSDQFNWSGTHSQSGVLIPYKPASGSVAADASLATTATTSAAATRGAVAGATLSATAATSAAATASRVSAAALAASASVTATANAAELAAADLTATAAVTATVSKLKTVTAALAAAVGVTAVATVTRNASASLTVTVGRLAKTNAPVSTTPPETALSLASSALAAEALTLRHGATVRHGVDVLDDTDTETGETLPFVDGSVAWSYRPPDPLAGQQNAVTAVRRQATLNVVGPVSVNLLARRFRIWTEFLLADEHWARWRLGVFMSAGPKIADDGVLITQALDLADKSYLWSQTKLTDPLHLDDTTAAIPWVISDLGTRFGETKFAISGDQTATVGGNGLTFDTDTDLLTVYSAVLASVGLDALTTDENGIATSQPLATIAGRGVSATYGAGARKIVPAGSAQPLIPTLPNVVRFVARQGPSSGGSEGNGIYTVRNQSTGPGSIDARGYEVQTTVQVDAADQTTLESIGDANKQRYFAGGGLTFSGSIGLNPTLGDQAVLSILLPRLGLSDPSASWTVTSWTYPLQPVNDPSAVLMPITAEARVT